MTAEKAPDWERIEVDYRAGVRSLREMAAEHGITEGAIRKKAKAQNWPRDLAAKVRAKAEQLVRNEVVRKEVRGEAFAYSEKQTVEVEAQVRARLELAQRSDSAELRTASMALVREIGSVAENAADLGRLAEIIESGDEGKMRDAVQRVISLPGRVKSFKDAADTAIKAVELERRVNRMDEGGSGGASDFERMLSDIHGAVT